MGLRGLLCLAAAAMIVAGCAGATATAGPAATPPVSTAAGPSGASVGTAKAGGSSPESPTATTPSSLSSSTPPSFCPGRTWPPYPLGGMPGVTAVSTDRATVEITNHAGRTYYYRVSGWELAQFETCRAFGELERQRGPIAPGATERVMIDPGWQQARLRVTVAVWDRPCGEACIREPIAAMIVELSPLEPAAS